MKHARDLYAYVGARTTQKRNARGDGLNVYRLTREFQWVHLQLLALENPSFLAFDRTGQCLYTVHGDSDRVSSFAIGKDTGTLTLLNEQSTRGHNPVHLSFDPSNRYMVVANHITSSLALLPRFDDGSLGPVCDLADVTGAIGPHRIASSRRCRNRIRSSSIPAENGLPFRTRERTRCLSLPLIRRAAS